MWKKGFSKENPTLLLPRQRRQVNVGFPNLWKKNITPSTSHPISFRFGKEKFCIHEWQNQEEGKNIKFGKVSFGTSDFSSLLLEEKKGFWYFPGRGESDIMTNCFKCTYWSLYGFVPAENNTLGFEINYFTYAETKRTWRRTKENKGQNKKKKNNESKIGREFISLLLYVSGASCFGVSNNYSSCDHGLTGEKKFL